MSLPVWAGYTEKPNVSVKVNAEGKGKVIIEVNSANEVDWLIKLMSERG